jgi:hypothetical protein
MFAGFSGVVNQKLYDDLREFVPLGIRGYRGRNRRKG